TLSPLGDHVVDLDAEVGKGLPQAGYQRLDTVGPADITCAEMMDMIGIDQLIACIQVAATPDVFEKPVDHLPRLVHTYSSPSPQSLSRRNLARPIVRPRKSSTSASSASCSILRAPSHTSRSRTSSGAGTGAVGGRT